ncbi:MAG: site-specific integrase [Tenericutes bacterium]|nr:site-specific integrase [Mycoplasmatota bacterium]
MYVSFEKAYYKYLKYVEIKQKRSSIHTLKEKFNNLILPYFKNFNIYNITAEDYIDFQYNLQKKKYSYNYLRNTHYLVVAFLDYCINFLNLKENVARKVGNFNNNNSITKNDFYTIKEFKKFIKYVDNEIYKQFFNLMFFTGTRPGEAMALRFSDLNDNILSITKTLDEHGTNGKRLIGTPKTKSSIRDISIDKKLKKDLLNLKKDYLKIYQNYDYDYYIFGGVKPLSPTTINRYKKKAADKAKIKCIRIHDFRHSHATLLLNKKIQIKVISKRLGHSNVDTTLNTYIHSDLSQEKRVIKTLNSIRY